MFQGYEETLIYFLILSRKKEKKLKKKKGLHFKVVSKVKYLLAFLNFIITYKYTIYINLEFLKEIENEKSELFIIDEAGFGT